MMMEVTGGTDESDHMCQLCHSSGRVSVAADVGNVANIKNRYVCS